MTAGTDPHVGWIGAGEMGTPMCLRLLDGGVDLTVFNRTPGRTDALRERGANIASSIADLGGLDVVFVMVTGDADVTEVVTGASGLLSAPARPPLIVNCSTVSEQASASIRAQCQAAGVGFLAAAVSAGPTMISDGTAAIVASGPDTAFAWAEPLLFVLARTVVHAGPGETATLVKLCSNVLMGTFTQNLFEIADLAAKAGVRDSALFDFINGSVIGSTYSGFKTAQYLSGETRLSEHQRALMLRDFDMCLDVARGLDASLPISETARTRI